MQVISEFFDVCVGLLYVYFTNKSNSLRLFREFPVEGCLKICFLRLNILACCQHWVIKETTHKTWTLALFIVLAYFDLA